ncbi:MAG: 4-hydroxy-tetrahydrodipicolinate synthase [Desulfobacteraceae bacterium]|nr:4-hydroxy-tetrahydrodipicolinate synthase [Desulfobacteraceae bacterium]MBC2753063.1 4-hydroxy-tetrahydrodipicolinate synthase [Desulfobacteraceae bacterium]
MQSGSYTAIITPFIENTVDYDGLDRLVDFQISNGITGVLAVGTTGESPSLSWDEHNQIIERIAKRTKGKCLCIAGTGSNNTREALEATQHAAQAGVDAVLLVDPYYNGPSSLEIRREYVAPIAAAFPDLQVIPYVIPGRTGAQLLPEDLGLLSQKHKNVSSVKEATGNLANMKRTRTCCGPDFTILSGDDGMTFDMMTDPEIDAGGVISVISNIAPAAVSELVRLLSSQQRDQAEALKDDLAPLFGLVTVSTVEKTPFGTVTARFRNPSAIKALMSIIGMPCGGCRRPLGKLMPNAIDVVLAAARKVQATNPAILKPCADFFGVDIDQRLSDPANWKDLVYADY